MESLSKKIENSAKINGIKNLCLQILELTLENVNGGFFVIYLASDMIPGNSILVR